MTFSAFKCCVNTTQSSLQIQKELLSVSMTFFFFDRNRKIHPKIRMESQENSQKKKKDLEKEQNWRTHISGFQNLTTKLQ